MREFHRMVLSHHPLCLYRSNLNLRMKSKKKMCSTQEFHRTVFLLHPPYHLHQNLHTGLSMDPPLDLRLNPDHLPHPNLCLELYLNRNPHHRDRRSNRRTDPLKDPRSVPPPNPNRESGRDSTWITWTC